VAQTHETGVRPSFTIEEAATPADVAEAKRLFVEYADSLGFSLCFQGFDRELAELPGRYARPAGRLLLARSGGDSAGCVALRALQPGIAEMKRLYVRPRFRGLGLGRLLARTVATEAREAGYHWLYLDTLPQMKEAIPLYRSMGFTEIPPYYDNRVEGGVFMKLDLSPDR
jgi:ribosomal protein S18 acetylase RimI-like enzyme